MTDVTHTAADCEILDWDSAFFGYRIARYRGTRCLAVDMPSILAECAAQAIDCLYVLVDGTDTESISNLLRHRAGFADIRVTFGTAGDGAAARPAAAEVGLVRPASAADIPALVRIASSSHVDTRFYADRHFDRARCSRLYEIWIEKSCAGYADAVFVVDAEPGQPAGYVTCHRGDRSNTGRIGLFAVTEERQGRGFGNALLGAAFGWFAAAAITDVTVATQLRNVRALRFYSRSGLAIRSVEYWFHLWPREKD
jgi:dTDP-4-amino-4,6-dideoxy-D-galactose acyltransferase